MGNPGLNEGGKKRKNEIGNHIPPCHSETHKELVARITEENRAYFAAQDRFNPKAENSKDESK